MGKRWSQADHYSGKFRRMERQNFYTTWDSALRPKSSDGTRRCVDCAKNITCDRSRGGNHIYCFAPSSSPGSPEIPEAETGKKRWNPLGLILLLLFIALVITLMIKVPGIWIFFLIALLVIIPCL